jgi:hypothetical protein
MTTVASAGAYLLSIPVEFEPSIQVSRMKSKLFPVGLNAMFGCAADLE